MNPFRYYRLIGQTPVPCSLEEWALNFEIDDRRVALTDIGPFQVSTVFLGLDHRHFGDGPPVLFETMTFLRDGQTIVDSAGMNDADGRTCTWLEAEHMHRAAIAWLEEHFCTAGEEPIDHAIWTL